MHTFNITQIATMDCNISLSKHVDNVFTAYHPVRRHRNWTVQTATCWSVSAVDRDQDEHQTRRQIRRHPSSLRRSH